MDAQFIKLSWGAEGSGCRDDDDSIGMAVLYSLGRYWAASTD